MSIEPAVTIEVLPAGRGDCLWVECARAGRRPWRMLVDGGTPESWPRLRERVRALAPGERELDLVVVSHIDSDHIGGMLPLLGARELDLSIGEVWFNGLAQLPDDSSFTGRSVSEGESLVALLSGDLSGAPALPWNVVFGGRAAMTDGDAQTRTLALADGPTITLLSPTPRRLRALRSQWLAGLERLRRGEPDEAPALAVPPARLDDLRALADTPTSLDASATNGSSIAFVLEYAGVSCLLAADAIVPVLGAALTSLCNERGLPALELDVFKLPHHASKANVSAKLMALAPARNYIVSTNGERFHHPDDIALARVLLAAPAGARLWFNYASRATLRWADPVLCDAHRYTTGYPTTSSGGVMLELPGRDR